MPVANSAQAAPGRRDGRDATRRKRTHARPQRLRRRTTAAQRGTAPGRWRPAPRPRPRHRLWDRADDPGGRADGPGGQCARGRRVGARDRARPRTGPGGRLGNVTFEHADAQVHRFPQEHFDLAISRFGTMFFDDPVAAFANIGRALRPAGRLVMMVWQARERNEWDVAIHRSLEAAEGPAAALARDRIRSRSPTRRPCEDPAGCRVRRRHLHRRPRTGLLRSGRRRRPRLGPRLHLHQRSPDSWVPPPRRARSSVCARRSPRT